MEFYSSGLFRWSVGLLVDYFEAMNLRVGYFGISYDTIFGFSFGISILTSDGDEVFFDLYDFVLEKVDNVFHTVLSFRIISPGEVVKMDDTVMEALVLARLQV